MVGPHEREFLRIHGCCAGRLADDRGAASAHPHVWVTMKSAVVYAPDGSITGVRHAWTFDDMYSAFATQGLESKKKGEFTPRGVEAAGAGQRRVAQGIRLLHLRQGRRQEGRFVEPVDYHLDFDTKETVLTLHFLLPLKTPVKAKALTSKCSIQLFRRFRAWPRRTRWRWTGAGRLQVQSRQAAGDERGDGAEACGNPAGRANSGQLLRGGIRQQDLGEMSLTRIAGERPAIALMLLRRRGVVSAGGRRLRCGIGAKLAVRRASRARRRRRRRHDRLDVRQAGRVLPALVAHHPRRQDRRHRGVDAVRPLVRLRHLPCRRSRPRQGGDLVLHGRQRGDLAARRRAVVRLGAAAGAGRGRDRRHRGGAAPRHRAARCATPSLHRDRQLRADRADRPAAVWVKGRAFWRCARPSAGRCTRSARR